jgi:spore germination cell wall hydrolase CwlJ-like protein
MTRRFRADGIAAASLALVATTAFAAPSAPTRAVAVAAPVLADHVSAPVAQDRWMDAFVNADAGTEAPGSRAPRAAAAATKSAGGEGAVSIAVRRSIRALVRAHASSDPSDPERECLAGAVYFEAQGEPIEGQLAVAEVVLNRAASGEYPSSICAVVTQPAQFSFVRDGGFPPIDRSSASWRRAVAVAHIAADHLANRLPSDVLWYHADYVAPGWGRRLDRVTQIGSHIFYRRG